MSEPKNYETIIKKRLAKRKRFDQLFHYFGFGHLFLAAACLFFILSTIFLNGFSALTLYELKVKVDLNSNVINPDDIVATNFNGLLKKSLLNLLPEVKTRKEKKALYKAISSLSEFELMKAVQKDPTLIGKVHEFKFALNDNLDQMFKNESDVANVSDQQQNIVDQLVKKDLITQSFNYRFFTNPDSRDPVQAGILSGAVGSLLTIFVTFILSFFIGLLAAVYLEEFAPKNMFTAFIEVNINNLAAVPSIIFGLLGLAVFINIMDFPRASPLLGGLILSLITIPTIIISARSSLKSVPVGIKNAALGIGASKMQAVFHQVVPAAMPGILTGSIIGIAQAFGETAPLLMIGMVAFISEIPTSLTEASTTLPVQIFLWANSPERGFADRGFLAIFILLVFLLGANSIAIYFREKFAKKYKQRF